MAICISSINAAVVYVNMKVACAGVSRYVQRLPHGMLSSARMFSNSLAQRPERLDGTLNDCSTASGTFTVPHAQLQRPNLAASFVTAVNTCQGSVALWAAATPTACVYSRRSSFVILRADHTGPTACCKLMLSVQHSACKLGSKGAWSNVSHNRPN